MDAVVDVLIIALTIYLIILFGRLVFDWVFVFARSWRPQGAMVVLLEVIYSLTDPPLKALRRILPPLRLGNVALDLAFIVLVILIYIAMAVLRSI